MNRMLMTCVSPGVALLLWACGSAEPPGVCGSGQASVVGGTDSCVFDGANADGNFACPDVTPFLYVTDDGVVCTAAPIDPRFAGGSGDEQGSGSGQPSDDAADPRDLGSPSLDLEHADAVWEGSEGGLAGDSISIADLDDDGADDLIIGDRDLHVGGRSSGERLGGVYVLYGGERESGTATLSGADAVVLNRSHVPNGEVAVVGDVDGDKYEDFLLPPNNLVFGGRERLSGEIHAADLGVALALSNDAEAIRVTGTGDVDGDGTSDLFITEYERAVVHVVLGRPRDEWGDGSGLEPHATVAVDDTAGLQLGRHSFEAHAVIDLDGDGLDELAVTAPVDPTQLGLAPDAGFSGDVYLFYGDTLVEGGTVPLARGVRVTVSDPDRLWNIGQSVVSGDFDGDGFGDLGITGSDYTMRIFYGEGVRYEGTLDYLTHDFAFGPADPNFGGAIYHAVGDINADHANEILFGVPSLGEQGGHSFLLLGGAPRREGDVDWADHDLRIRGRSDDLNGTDKAGIVALGDLDGDDFDDVVIGAPGNRIGDDYGGRVYVIYSR